MAGNEVDSWKQQLPEIPTHSQMGKGVCVLGHTSVGLSSLEGLVLVGAELDVSLFSPCGLTL